MRRGRRLSRLLLLALVGCRQDARNPASTYQDVPPEEHELLAGSFVSGDSALLRRVLHDDVLVQPPTPDSALQGSAARSYLLELAANTRALESRLHPRMIKPEGPFALEQGLWELRVGDRRLHSPYILRWRLTPAGWRVILWRWERFR
jgi:hypothetical protein